MSSTEIFDCFIVGLAKLLKQDCLYPHPDLLRRACNQLSLHMKEVRYPRTMAGLFDLFERPVKSWYPFRVPHSFDSDFGVMYNGQLSEEAAQYFYVELLERARLPESASGVTQQLVSEHYQFQMLFERLREKYQSDPENAQKDYVLLRTFLIENPYPTISQLRQRFGRRKTKYLDAQEVGGLYNSCDESVVYWKCDRCGPLSEKYEHLYGNKPSICDDHRKSLPFVHRIDGRRELLRIKKGIHMRVCLPGIPELQLFRRLEALVQYSPKDLYSVSLYPGLDRYDLHLRFSDDTVWAVDVKDYRNPYQLASKLSSLYGEGSLKYAKGFYVVPDSRVQQCSNYLQIVREQAKLPASIRIMHDIQFESCVVAKIESLKRESGANETR